MLTNYLRTSTLALLAILGLLFATACEPGTFDQDRPDEERLEEEEAIGGGPDDPWAQPGDPAPGMDEPADPTLDEPAMDEPMATDGFEQGLEDINRGLQEITSEAQRRADELGQDVDEATRDLQERVETFRQEIERDIEALRTGEVEEETPAEDEDMM